MAGPSEGLKKIFLEGMEVEIQDLVKGKVFLLFLPKYGGGGDWASASDGPVI